MISILKKARTSPASRGTGLQFLLPSTTNGTDVSNCMLLQRNLRWHDGPWERHSQGEGMVFHPRLSFYLPTIFLAVPKSPGFLRLGVGRGSLAQWLLCVHLDLNKSRRLLYSRKYTCPLCLINLQNTPHIRVMEPPVQTSASVSSLPIVRPLLLIIT